MEHESDVAPGLDLAPSRVSCDCDYSPLMTDMPHRAWCASVTGFHAEPVDLRPGITVAIAAHPARFTTYLAEAIASAVNQTLQPAAIIVYNDQERHGAGGSRRALLDQVQTEWIAWLDSDDVWYPQHLSRCYTTAVETESIYVFPWFDGGDPLGHFGLEFNPCTPHHTTMGHLVRTDIAKRVGFMTSRSAPSATRTGCSSVGSPRSPAERA